MGELFQVGLCMEMGNFCGSLIFFSINGDICRLELGKSGGMVV